jgi:hypothetical protein
MTFFREVSKPLITAFQLAHHCTCCSAREAQNSSEHVQPVPHHLGNQAAQMVTPVIFCRICNVLQYAFLHTA